MRGADDSHLITVSVYFRYIKEVILLPFVDEIYDTVHTVYNTPSIKRIHYTHTCTLYANMMYSCNPRALYFNSHAQTGFVYTFVEKLSTLMKLVELIFWGYSNISTDMHEFKQRRIAFRCVHISGSYSTILLIYILCMSNENPVGILH